MPARVNSPSHHYQHQQSQYSKRNEPSNASFRSSASSATTTGQHSLAMLSLPQSTASVQHVEAQIRIKYSGGEAMQQGYCRQCAISFNLELLPSAVITSWDVLPAEV